MFICAHVYKCLCACVCERVCVSECACMRIPENEMSKNKHTVRMVGVTKAQHSLQNRFGWKPIIISMSSQNLCRPAKEEEKREEIKEEKWERFPERRHGVWPGFNNVPLKKRIGKFNLSLWAHVNAFLWSLEKVSEQMASFLCLYWRITVSDMKWQSHTIISICHLHWCSDKLEASFASR